MRGTPIRTITDAKLRNEKVDPAKDRKIFIGDGLYLLITKKGSRLWRLKYRFNGTEKLLAFGRYPEITLQKARELCFEARRSVAAGIDPGQLRQQEKAKASGQVVDSFETIARDWFKLQRLRWASKKYAETVIASLERDVFPQIGSLPIQSVSRKQILNIYKAVEERDALDVMHRIHQRCSEVFAHAIHEEKCATNPCEGLAKGLTKRPVKHRPMLTEEELPGFLCALQSYRGSRLVQLALRLLVLTMLRPGELRFARWEEINLEAAEWRIPPARMKMKEGRPYHLVYLSRQAVEVLTELRRLTGDFELVFPGVRHIHKPISDVTLLKAIKIMGYGERCVPHGFRSTASTILNERFNFSPDAIERQLAHVPQNRIRSAYNRAEYLAERRTMLQAWADKLDALEAQGRKAAAK